MEEIIKSLEVKLKDKNISVEAKTAIEIKINALKNKQEVCKR